MSNKHIGQTWRFLVAFALVLAPGFFFVGIPKLGFSGVGSGYAAVPADAQRDDVVRIVAFGSSSTRGFGATTEATTYPADLQRLFDERRGTGSRVVVVINRGLSGEDMAGMSRRLNDDVLSRRPDLVVWQIGSNDALKGVSLTTFSERLRAGIASIRAKGSKVILMGPQWSPRLEHTGVFASYVDAVRSIGREARVPVIDRVAIMKQWVRDGLVSEADLIGPDGLHMTDRGYQLLAEAAYRVIDEQSIGHEASGRATSDPGSP